MTTMARRTAEAVLPTRYGTMRIVGYEGLADGGEHVALVRGDLALEEAPLVRLHSECLTGDVFGSLRCDCGPQLDLALRAIATERAGAVLLVTRHRGQFGGGLGIPLLDLRERLGAVDVLEPDVGIAALSDGGGRAEREQGGGEMLDHGAGR